jgi:hypothetical protein
MGALCRSALIPGWGQWYTGHRWKGVLVAGAELFFAGAAWHEDVQISRSSTASEAGQHRTRRTTFVLWLVGTLVYSLADAYVDAHLYGFEEDLERVAYGRLGWNGHAGETIVRLSVRF